MTHNGPFRYDTTGPHLDAIAPACSVGKISISPIPRSWECSKCGTVWAPHVEFCGKCSSDCVVTYGAYEKPI